MTKDLHWQTDPVVVLEGCILPLMSAGPELLYRLTIADQHPPEKARLHALLEAFTMAEVQLRDGGAQYLGPVGMRLAKGDLQQCVDAADLVAHARQQLQTALTAFRTNGQAVNGKGREIADFMADKMIPGVNVALDVFRRVFIGTVLERQTAQAKQADSAISQLSEIGETIFFISINASIEASRIGDRGRGFAVIGEHIRELSQKARDATWSLSTILDGPAKSNRH